MLKNLAFMVRRPALSREAFAQHYEQTHAPLALPSLHGLQRYVRNHLEPGEEAPEPFDCLTELWFSSAEAARRVREAMLSPAGLAIRADELRFMDKPRNRSVSVLERVLCPARDSGPEAARETLIVLFEPDGPGFEGLLRRELPRLLAGPAAPRACALHRVLGGFTGRPEALESVLTLSPGPQRGAREGLSRWAREQGARAALWSRRCATPRADMDAAGMGSAGRER